jgi:hypothetical protein
MTNTFLLRSRHHKRLHTSLPKMVTHLEDFTLFSSKSSHSTLTTLTTLTTLIQVTCMMNNLSPNSTKNINLDQQGKKA